MRLLRRNTTTVTYQLYVGKVPVEDSEGYKTGEFKVVYSTMHEVRATVSVATGDLTLELFGVNNEYDKILLIDDKSCLIDEYSKVYINNEEYKVERVSQSLNYISVAVKKVTTNGYQN